MDSKDSMEVFERAPVPQAVLKNTVPAMAAMLMVLIYNLADTFFIGQTRNDILVAAVSLATPVFLIFMALGTILESAVPRSFPARWARAGRNTPKRYAPFVCGAASRQAWSYPLPSCSSWTGCWH